MFGQSRHPLSVGPVGIGQPTDMAWDGKGEEGTLWLGLGSWGPSQSTAAANTRVGQGQSKPQKGSAGLHRYGKVQSHSLGAPTGLTLQKSQSPDGHTQKQMLHTSGTLPTSQPE